MNTSEGKKTYNSSVISLLRKVVDRSSKFNAKNKMELFYCDYESCDSGDYI